MSLLHYSNIYVYVWYIYIYIKSLRSLFCSPALFVYLCTSHTVSLGSQWALISNRPSLPSLFLKSVLANVSSLHFYVHFSTSLSGSNKTNKNKNPGDFGWNQMESIAQSEENWSLQYWVVQSMNMVYLFTFLDLLDFLLNIVL